MIGIGSTTRSLRTAAATWVACTRTGTAAPSSWFWSITVGIDPDLGITTSGRAPMMNEAKEHFLARIGTTAHCLLAGSTTRRSKSATIPAAPSRNAEGLSMPERMAGWSGAGASSIGIGQSAAVRTGYQGSAGLKATPDELVALVPALCGGPPRCERLAAAKRRGVKLGGDRGARLTARPEQPAGRPYRSRCVIRQLMTRGMEDPRAFRSMRWWANQKGKSPGGSPTRGPTAVAPRSAP